jgi:dipeptidyl aminopeptidase/acylaminoacyl peptidase
VGGDLFFMRENTLMVQPFDAGKLQLLGEPVPVAEHVGGSGSVAYFSVSRTGVLAYRTGPAINGGGGTLPTWFDRQGKVTSIVGQPFFDQPLVLSPDATRAAGRDAANQARGDIWWLEFARGIRTRLTFRQSPGTLPVWSPDGSRIAFSAGNAAETIYEKAVSGAGDEKELMKASDGPNTPTSWSRDGRFLLYTGRAPKTGADIWVLPMVGDRKPSLLLGTQFIEGQARFSPDGRWISYTSDESGRNEVYIRPFMASGPSGGAPSLGAGKWQLSKDGGNQARWRDDGKEIVFLGPGRSVMAVDVNGSGTAFQVGALHLLFTAPPSPSVDMASDGKRFLLNMEPGQVQAKTAAPIAVVLNWQADLKR